MAKQTRISKQAAMVMCGSLVGLLEAGSDLVIYDGAVPTDLDVPLGDQDILAILSLPFPAFGPVVDAGSRVKTTCLAVLSAPAIASSLATFFRALDNDGDPIIQGTVGLADSDLVLSSTNIVSGVSVRVNSWNLYISKEQTVC